MTFLLVICLTGAAEVQAQLGLALMKVEPAARPSGMGGAFVSVTGDPNAPAYNPAGAVMTERFVASLGHNTYWTNVRLETGYAVAPLSSRTYLHGGFRFASVDDIEGRSAPSAEPDVVFEARDISFKAGLAYRYTERFSAGFAVGWFMEKIGAWRGSAFNVDAGLLYRITPVIVVGASVVNNGCDFNLKLDGNPSSEDIALPTTYRAGGSYRYDRYLGAVDVVMLEEKVHVHAGAEAVLHESLSIRSGYMFNYDSKNFTAGASFTRHNFTFDYAFVPYTNDLGTSHLFNLTVTI
ncbi:MAG TPA: PorV/PorQ family protein [Acidobacteriota bacterium]|nr:PorV/PorQ family protein [Acidobacteriota bacterium]